MLNVLIMDMYKFVDSSCMVEYFLINLLTKYGDSCTPLPPLDRCILWYFKFTNDRDLVYKLGFLHIRLHLLTMPKTLSIEILLKFIKIRITFKKIQNTSHY